MGGEPFEVAAERGKDGLSTAMVAATTALGILPLFFVALFAATAVTIVIGLDFATFLMAIILPVFYSIAYRVKAR